LSPEHADDEMIDGLLILRPEGRLFFINAQTVADQIAALQAQYHPRVLVLDMSRVPDIEYSALQMLIEGDKRATERGAAPWLVGLNPGVLEVVRNSGLDKQLGPERLLFNARTAIERYKQLQAAEADLRASPGP
jgi:sulfate permease, SulP family